MLIATRFLISSLVTLLLSGCVVLLPFVEQDKKYDENGGVYEQGVPVAPAYVRPTARDPLVKHLKQLDTDDAAARTRACTALGEFGPRARPAVPKLVMALDDPSKNVRRAAVKALGRIGGSEVKAPIQRKLNDPDRYVRQTAANVLKRLP